MQGFEGGNVKVKFHRQLSVCIIAFFLLSMVLQVELVGAQMYTVHFICETMNRGDQGSITFAGTPYYSGQSASYSLGDYWVTANPPSPTMDWFFYRWQVMWMGSQSWVDNEYSQSTWFHLRGEAYLNAEFYSPIHTNNPTSPITWGTRQRISGTATQYSSQQLSVIYYPQGSGMGPPNPNGVPPFGGSGYYWTTVTVSSGSWDTGLIYPTLPISLGQQLPQTYEVYACWASGSVNEVDSNVVSFTLNPASAQIAAPTLTHGSIELGQSVTITDQVFSSAFVNSNDLTGMLTVQVKRQGTSTWTDVASQSFTSAYGYSSVYGQYGVFYDLSKTWTPTETGTYDVRVIYSGNNLYLPISNPPTSTLTVNEQGYDATINAHCNIEGIDVSVAITKDSLPLGYDTPHTFIGLTGTHQFTVPDTDPHGHPFQKWNTGEASTTITVSSGGTYTAYYQPEGNLVARGMQAVQVVYGEDLILDKKTSFKIWYSSTFTEKVEAEVRIDLDGFNLPHYIFKAKFFPENDYFFLHSVDIAPVLKPQTKPVVKYKLTINSNGQIFETHENDNTYPHSGMYAHEVKDTRPLRLLFVPVRFNGEDGYPGGFNGFSKGDFDNHVEESIRYIKATYPLSESEVLGPPDDSFSSVLNGGPRPTTESEANRTMWEIIGKLARRAGNLYDRVIGVVRENWFIGLPDDPSTPFQWSRVGGFTLGEDCKAGITELKLWQAAAHEIGHTYGLEHPESSSYGDGYYVDGGVPVFAETFMVAEQRFKEKAVPQYWIRPQEYGDLTRALRVRDDPEIILVSGTFWRNGTVDLDEWYRFLSGTPDYEEGIYGNHSIVQVDSVGSTLSVVSFNVTFVDYCHGYTFDRMPFAFTIPYASGTREIKIVNATGKVVASRVISDNAPMVHLISPNGGEILTSNHVQVSWEATDLDGDSLAYTLLISSNGGITWNPIEAGLKQTTSDLFIAGFSGGSEYILKVIASDGVNTEEDVSDGPFTISSFTVDVNTPPQVIVHGDKTNYTLTLTSYGGFSGSVTLSANSTTENLIFRWIIGPTVTLTSGGSTTAILEVEAANPIGGNHTIIVSGVSSDHIGVTLTYVYTTVHDIAIVNMTSSKTVVGQGFTLTINLTIQNQGHFWEDFNLILYYNSTLLANNRTYLHAGTSTIITFTWNTTGVPYGNYTITANTTILQGETDTADNTFTDGMVLVTIPGDVNGDGVVDLFDAATCSAHWYPGPPIGPLSYDVNADINNDGNVDILDAAIVNAHWGQTW